MKHYTIYNKSTDEIIALGTAKECQKQMSLKSKHVFYCIVSRIYRGKSKKYEIYVSENNNEDLSG